MVQQLISTTGFQYFVKDGNKLDTMHYKLTSVATTDVLSGGFLFLMLIAAAAEF